MPGDVVCVNSGTYNEAVKISVSGTPGAPIVFQSGYDTDSAPAILDGTGISSNPIGFTITDHNYITIFGFEIQNYTTNGNALPAGVFISGSSSNISIFNNHIHNVKVPSNGNGFGLAVYGTSATPANNINVIGNELNNLQTGTSESMTFNGNVTNFKAIGNKVHDNSNIGIDVIGYEGSNPNVNLDIARNGLIAENVVYNISVGVDYGADGIYVDGGAFVTIERNLISNANLGIEVTSEHTNCFAQYVTVRNNLITASSYAGLSIGGYGATSTTPNPGYTHDGKINTSTCDPSRSPGGGGLGGTWNSVFVNNTFYSNGIELNFNGQAQSYGNVFENNIIYASSTYIAGAGGYVSSSGVPTITLSHNLYYGSNNAPATDIGKVLGNPLFQSVVWTDSNFLKIFPQSLAVGAGIMDLNGSVYGATDYAGVPRIGAQIDIGAYIHG
jgi:hypothetical protein